MARMQNHHITYEPEWTTEINMLMHRTISRIQITKATEAQYATVTNFAHALMKEWNRLRMELDIGGDYREQKPKKEPKPTKEPKL